MGSPGGLGAYGPGAGPTGIPKSPLGPPGVPSPPPAAVTPITPPMGVSEIAPVIPRTGYDSLAAIEEAYQNDEIELWEAEAAVYESIMEDIPRFPFQSDAEWQEIVAARRLEAKSRVRQWREDRQVADAAAREELLGEDLDQLEKVPSDTDTPSSPSSDGGRPWVPWQEKLAETPQWPYGDPRLPRLPGEKTPEELAVEGGVAPAAARGMGIVESLAIGALGTGDVPDRAEAYRQQYGFNTLMYDLSPKEQYEAVMRESMGSLANHATVAQAIDRNYSSVLGRWVLQNLMEIQEEDLEWEWFPDFITRGFKEKPAEFFNQGQVDDNWAKFVKYSGMFGAKGLTGQDAIGLAIANIPTYQIAAAKAKAGITGRGTYGQLAERAFDTYVQRYQQEMTIATPDKQMGLAAWLDKNIGGQWAVGPEEKPARVIADPTYGTKIPVTANGKSPGWEGEKKWNPETGQWATPIGGTPENPIFAAGGPFAPTAAAGIRP